MMGPFPRTNQVLVKRQAADSRFPIIDNTDKDIQPFSPIFRLLARLRSPEALRPEPIESLHPQRDCLITAISVGWFAMQPGRSGAREKPLPIESIAASDSEKNLKRNRKLRAHDSLAPGSPRTPGRPEYLQSRAGGSRFPHSRAPGKGCARPRPCRQAH